MIKPSIGRVVWFTPAKNDAALSGSDQPLAAIVTYVHSDRCVNLAVFDANGGSLGRTSAALLQDEDVGNEGGYFAQWMPYQAGQATKQTEPEAAAKARTTALHMLGAVKGDPAEHLRAVHSLSTYIISGELPAALKTTTT